MSKPLPEDPGDLKERTTLYVSRNMLRKIRYVIFQEETTQTEVVDRALAAFFEQWEKDNGPVPPPAKPFKT